MSESLSPLIEASLSPVFLLSAIAVTLTVIDTQQNRIVDRVRLLEGLLSNDPASIRDGLEEVGFYIRRVRRIGVAASLCILSAICVAAVVIMLLIDAQTAVSLALPVEVCFAAAVLFYGVALVLFLHDMRQVNRGLAYVERRIAAARPDPPAPGA
jgi:hypothetical protein